MYNLVLPRLKDSCTLSVHTPAEGIQYSTGITCLESFFTPTDRLELTSSSQSLGMPDAVAAAMPACAAAAAASDALAAAAAASLKPDMPGIVCCISGRLWLDDTAAVSRLMTMVSPPCGLL